MDKAIVFGAGLSGLGAKELLEKKGYEAYLIDDKVAMPSTEGIKLLNEEKTMEEKEIAQVMDSLVNVFKKQFNAELRS